MTAFPASGAPVGPLTVTSGPGFALRPQARGSLAWRHWVAGGGLLAQQHTPSQERPKRTWRCRWRNRADQARAALFDPPPFSPQKLRVEYLPGAEHGWLCARRYTLTHNDLTGTLLLSIGGDYNHVQLAGWYTRAVRDEVLAEWVQGGGGEPRLHVYCHVSGEEAWPAPPALRSFIFQREMCLVLDTIAYAERGLLDAAPSLRAAPVCLHLRSHLPHLDVVLEWGRLGDRASWPRAASTLLQALLGQPILAAPWEAGCSNGPGPGGKEAGSAVQRWRRQQQQQHQQLDGGCSAEASASFAASQEQQYEAEQEPALPQQFQQQQQQQPKLGMPTGPQQQQFHCWREAGPCQPPNLAMPGQPPGREWDLGIGCRATALAGAESSSLGSGGGEGWPGEAQRVPGSSRATVVTAAKWASSVSAVAAAGAKVQLARCLEGSQAPAGDAAKAAGSSALSPLLPVVVNGPVEGPS